MNIAFCTNRLGLPGLAVALASMIRNCSQPGNLHIWLLCSGISDANKQKLIRLLDMERFTGKINFINFDPAGYFDAFNSLHGDRTTFGRLLLSEMLDVDQVLYLDTDLLIEADVYALSQFNLNGHILAAVGGGMVKYTLGNKFYINKANMHPEMEYFNAGVLLLNLSAWRSGQFTQRCMDIARRNPQELPSHDQSILNILCGGRFAHLPPLFNCAWTADMLRPQGCEHAIFHFLGSPKPWDFLGSLMHKGYDAWALYWNKDWGFNLEWFSSANLYRTWMIRRSYLRQLRNRLIAKHISF